MRALIVFVFLTSISIPIESSELPGLVLLDIKPEGVSGFRAGTLSDRLRQKFENSERVNLMKRDVMGKILTEQKQKLTGCVEEECVVRMSKILNVNNIIAGSLSKVDSTKFALFLKLLSFQDSMVFTTVMRMEGDEIELKKWIESSSSWLLYDMVTSAGKVVKINNDSIYIKIPSGTNIGIGAGFEIVRKTDKLTDSQTGEVLCYEKEIVGVAEAKEILQDTLLVAQCASTKNLSQLIKNGDIAILQQKSSVFRKLPPELDQAKISCPPKILEKSCVHPEYPEDMLKKHIEGRVLLEILVDTTGQPIGIKVLYSPHPSFTKSAIEAISKWRLIPAKQKDIPVRTTITMPVRFVL